jgi:hypothetical protein
MTTGGQWPPPDYGENVPPDGQDVPPNDADPAGGQPPRTGSINFQDPSNTTPREPTLAESRAREHAAKAQQAAEAAWWDEQQKRAKRRKRILIGGGVGIGLVALIALAYSSSHPSASQARCVGPDNVVVADSNCAGPVSNGGYYQPGGIIPIFIGGGGRQYHYTYGGSGGYGQVATGGTTVPPRGSGSTSGSGSLGPGNGSYSDPDSGSSSVRRGGFGVSSPGHSSGS